MNKKSVMYLLISFLSTLLIMRKLNEVVSFRQMDKLVIIGICYWIIISCTIRALDYTIKQKQINKENICFVLQGIFGILLLTVMILEKMGNFHNSLSIFIVFLCSFIGFCICLKILLFNKKKKK